MGTPHITLPAIGKNAVQLAATATIILLLGGCLVRVAYNNADTLIRWELDRYFDLTPEQIRLLDRRLPPHLTWHRTQELPRTIALLRRAHDAIGAGLTDATLIELTRELTALQAALTEQLLPDTVDLFARLDAEQLEFLRHKLARANEEWEERLELPPDERRDDRRERILDQVEDWLGDLDKKQSSALALASDSIPDILDAWLKHRKERQREFVELVALARTEPDTARAGLRRWFTTGTPEQFTEHRAAVRAFILEVDRSATPKQRAHAQKRLRVWIEDLETFLKGKT